MFLKSLQDAGIYPFFLLLVRKIKWKSRSFTLAQKIKVEWHLHDVINLLWKEFAIWEKGKTLRLL